MLLTVEQNKQARNILWNNSNSKIAFDDVIRPYEEGGMKFPSPEYRIKSQKLTWVKKLFDRGRDGIWKETFLSNVNI